MTVGLSMLGLHQPAFWGGVAGVLYSIPYVGPIIVGIALMLAAFVQFDSFVAALEIASVPLVVFSLEGFLVKPAIMGKAARVNGLAMFLGLLFWGWVWGLVGIVVAVPIMMVIKTVCDRIEGLHAVGALLDEN
jgi:predicted PurR-regulated permease PerM